MTVPLQTAVTFLTSEKATERTAGIDAYRQIFQREKTLKSLQGDDATWVRVFQAVFQCVHTERDAFQRKGGTSGASTALLNRLTAASRLLRWLVERAVLYFERKTVRPLVNHIVQTLELGGQLLQPIALDYTKSLRTILERPAHRHSLDDDQWTRSVTLCFNIVNSHNLHDEIPEPDESFWTIASSAEELSTADNRALGLEDIEEMSCLEQLMSSSYAPLVGEKRYGVRILAQYIQFLEAYTTESTAHAPTIAGINQVLRHLQVNQSAIVTGFATRSWRPLVRLWASKTKMLREHLVATFRLLLPHIKSANWDATNPARSSSPPSDRPSITEKQLTLMLDYLHRQLTSDADNRFNIASLDMGSLRLAMPYEVGVANPSEGTLFQTHIMGAGRSFTSAAALSWATLELAADVIAQLIAISSTQSGAAADASAATLSESEDGLVQSGSRKRAARSRPLTQRTPAPTKKAISSTASRTQPSPTKRRKIDAAAPRGVLQSFLYSLQLDAGESQAKAQPRRMWNLQVLIFLAERHGSCLSESVLADTLSRIKDLLQDNDAEIQNWALLACAAFARLQAPILPAAMPEVWNIVTRKVNQPAHSRAASLAATILAKSGHLDKTLLLAELSVILNDLELSAPPFPWDSVCQLFALALDFCSNDVVLAKRHYDSKLLAWLFKSWRSTDGIEKGFQSRVQVQEQDVSCTYELLIRIHDAGTRVRFFQKNFTMPGSPTIDQMLHEQEVSPVLEFLLEAKLDSNMPGKVNATKSNDVQTESQNKATMRSPTALELRTTRYFCDSLALLCEEWSASSHDDVAFAAIATVEQTRRSLDVAVLALLLDATLHANAVRSDGNLFAQAQSLLDPIAQTLGEGNRWSIAERASLLCAMHPIIAGPIKDPWQGVQHLLKNELAPGLRSGLRRDRLNITVQTGCRPILSSPSPDWSISLIWSRASGDACDSIVRHLQACLEILCEIGAEDDEQETAGADEWGKVKQAKVDSASLMKPAENIGNQGLAVALSASICTSALVEIPRIAGGAQPLTQVSKHLINLLADGSMLAVDRAGSETFRAIANGALKISDRSATLLMTTLGTEYLPSYQFVKSEHAQLLVLDFLEATMDLWLAPGKVDTDLAARSEEFCLHFSRALQKSKAMTWRVRTRVASFFESLLQAVVRRDAWNNHKADSFFRTSELHALICRQAGDSDTRVRFAAGAMIARLFDQCEYETEEYLFKDACSMMLGESSHLEAMLTRGLTSANAMVMSSPVRAAAFFILLEPCMLNKVTDVHIASLLAFVSHSLGFPDARELFRVFAAQLTFGWLSSGYDTTRLPYAVLGYPSMRSCLEHTFEDIGSMMAAMSVDQPEFLDQLSGLARSIRKSELDGVKECLPSVVAIELILAIRNEDQLAPEDMAAAALRNMRQRLRRGDRPLTDEAIVDETLKSAVDKILRALLMQFWDNTAPSTSPFDLMLEIANESASQVMRALEQGAAGARLKAFQHEPVRPNAEGVDIYVAMLAVMDSLGADAKQAIVFHVTHAMLSVLYAERFVNDQLRHFTALNLFLAFNAPWIEEDAVMLRILLHGGTILIQQPDLAFAASGLLSWTLEKIRGLSKAPPQLSASFIKIGESINQFYSCPQEEQQKMGTALFAWYDDQLLRLLECNTTARHGLDASCAYPRDFPQPIGHFFASKPLTLCILTDAIKRNGSTAVGSHLLARVRQAISGGSSPEEMDAFARVSIWRIFARLSPQDSTEETVETSRVLADIIFSLDGAIKTPSAAQQQAATQDAKSALLQYFLDKGDNPLGPLQAFVTIQVLEVTREDDLALAEVALQTLRVAIQSQEAFVAIVDKWPEGTVEELQYIAALPLTAPAPEALSSQVALTQLKTSSAKANDWTCAVAANLCSKLAASKACSFYAHISGLMASISSLASSCFSALLHAVLVSEQETQSASVRDEITTFFTKILDQPSASREVLSTIVHAHLYLRQQAPIVDSDASDGWLSTDYLLLARRSITCQLYTTALLFLELHREHQPDDFAKQQGLVSDLLFEVYTHVEDPDSFYAVQTDDVERDLVRTLHHEEDRQGALMIHSAEFEAERARQSVGTLSSDSAYRGIRLSLHKLGYDRMAGLLSESTSSPALQSKNIDYEVAWRTEDWHMPLPSELQSGSGAGVLSALRALHRDRDVASVQHALEGALHVELKGLRGAGVEAISLVRDVSRDLMCVRQAELWHAKVRYEQHDLAEVLSQVDDWPNLSQAFHLQDYETIQAVRQSLLRAERRLAEADQIGDMMEPSSVAAVSLESRLLLETSKMARRHDKPQMAMNAITTAKRLTKLLPDGQQHADVFAEHASVLWAQGQHSFAIRALEEQLQSVAEGMESSQHKSSKAFLLAQMGEWAAVAHSQQPRDIDEKFFRPAVGLVQKDKKHRAIVSYRYACFADEQYRKMSSSREIGQLELFIAHRQEEIRQNSAEMERVGSRSNAYRSLSHHRNQAEKILKQDLSTLQQHQQSRSFFLEQALNMYANALSHSDQYDEAVVRLTSLWFENSEDDKFNHAIAEALQAVPAHKFIRLTHQLSSRLSKTATNGSRSPIHPFHANLFALMDRICQQHPFHTLYAIYALRKADFDARASNSGKGSSRSSLSMPPSQQARSAAAHALWDKAKSSSPHKSRILYFEQACDGYVQWAELDLKAKMPHLFSGGSIRKGPYRFVAGMNLALKALPKGVIPVATAKIPLDPSGQYKEIPTIERYSDMFNTAGGLHLPKIIECIATDGKRYKQLFKSNDDLRQDAVMQQVFTLLNELLIGDRRAHQRELNIRTYAVIPLGPQCGLLEFVGNTSPIGDVLISTHEKHRKEGELTPAQARSEIAAVMGKTPRDKLETFRKVCHGLPPAFHYYFLERFKVPSTWFAARLNYSRSLATTSIIGHVLGLGDRHVSNILLDNVSGEMIHIDFGVAFEQGKLLPIPELVPFRLTRDLVDGMGLSGVEGVFRRCCEETLRVLREHSDVIKTVLEVFKFDPLWAWTTNPVKVLRAQRTSGASEEPMPTPTPGGSGSRATTPAVGIEGRDTASLSAERAIGSVMSKLSSGLSVQSTVNELIQDATDEGNLSAIFHGWQAAL